MGMKRIIMLLFNAQSETQSGFVVRSQFCAERSFYFYIAVYLLIVTWTDILIYAHAEREAG